jgi:hypothetical protein
MAKASRATSLVGNALSEDLPLRDGLPVSFPNNCEKKPPK